MITQPEPKVTPLRRYGPYALAVAVPALFLLLFRLVCHNRVLVNWVIWHVTTPYKQAVAALCAHLPFSMAEVCWTVAIGGIAAFVIRSAVVLFRSIRASLAGERAHPLRIFLRRALALLSAGLFIYSGYTLNWGINYYGDTFSQRSGLVGRTSGPHELYLLTAAFANRCAELSTQVPRNEDGLYDPDLDDIFDRSVGLYQSLYEEFPCLDLPEAQARPMFYSPIMSRMSFTGFFFPFTGESMVNVDAPECLVPVTILHELAHQRNVAMEDECNFLAILAGTKCEDVEFQYSAALMGFIHAGNALYSVSKDLYRQAYVYLSAEAKADLEFNTAFWDQYDKTPAADTAEAIYSAFARSYEQKDIMKSYGACVDLLVAYYIPTN